MSRNSPHLTALLIVALLLVGAPGALSVERTQQDEGDKARVAVGEMTSSDDECTAGMTMAISDMLSSALANSDKFVVVDDVGAMGNTGIVVNGTIKKFDPESGGGMRARALREVGVDEKSAEIEIDFRLVDGGSGRVLESKSVKAKSTNWDADDTGGSWVEDIVLAGALGEYDGEPMEDAIREVLARAVEMIGKEIPDEYFRFTGEEQLGVAAGVAGGASGSAGVAEDMSLFTRYDFVPGNKIIFYDDMADEEVGEFPYRWNLDSGVYEVVRFGGEFWIMATDDGSVRPRIPDAELPTKYTVELEFYNHGPEYTGNYFYLHWVGDDGRNIGSFGVYSNESTWLEIGGRSLADKKLATELTKGIHTLRVMATTRSIKCYVDEERVCNVPKVEGFAPVGFRLRHRPYRDPDNPTLFRGFRFAEGGKSMRDQLDEDGKIVTHGILFDSGSYTIKGESYKTLADIGQLLQDDPELRLSIEGHTDSDGSEEQNQALSQNRANSVLEYLIATYSIERDRLEAKGWGEAKPIDANDSAEGKANNRRVELVKL
jgi:curli biogenesis system outer membrane secretion channel CsgG